MAQNDDAKRATTVITIAQLKFKQGVKKEEPEAGLSAVPVESCSHLFSAVDAVLAQNTPVNIQTCTEWIVKHIAPSRIRIAVLGDYLVSISKSLVVDTSPAAARKAVRNRLDLLLVLNDALHTDKYHHSSSGRHRLLGTELSSHLVELVELAALCATEKESQVEKKLKAIINYWTVNKLVGDETCKALRERTDESLLQAQGGTPVRRRNYLLPEYHGDRTAPWYELPASYMLDQMIKQPNRPLDPHRIRAARFDKKPASAHVRSLLDKYFENIDLKHTPTGDNPTGATKKYNMWLDPLGQLVKCDKETGETTTASNGYGWSIKFCQDMQKDGLPESIKTLRDDARLKDSLPEKERDPRRYSRSPRPRRRSSSMSSHGRDRGRRSRSGSYASRSSYDSRSRSRSRTRDRRRRSPRTEDRGRSNRNKRFDDFDNDGSRPPPRPIERGQSHSSGQWSGQQASNRNSQGSPGNGSYPQSGPQNFVPNFSQAPQPPYNTPPFTQPPMPNQFPGPFPMQAYPPPPPMSFQPPGAFPGGLPAHIPPPPPPNYSGSFPPPPPNVVAMPNNPYNFNNQWNNFHQGGPPGFNQQSQGSPQNQGFSQNHSQGHGGFQGARGGYGHQPSGGGYNSRGGYSGRALWRTWIALIVTSPVAPLHDLPIAYRLFHGFREYPPRDRRVMAPPKRKRIPTRNTSNKRPKYTQPDTSSSSGCNNNDSSSSSDSEEIAISSQQNWEALRILAQTGQGFGLRYLIEWAGTDLETGKQWEPSWVKANNASEGLRAAWKRTQAHEAQEERRAAQQRSIQEAPRARGRPRKQVAERPAKSLPSPVAESPTGSKQSAAATVSPSTLEVGGPLLEGSSTQVTVDVHEVHSEIPESQPCSLPDAAAETDLESSQLFASQPAFCASGVVLDTQSSAGDLSFIPVTQEELESSVVSDTSDESEDQVADCPVSEWHTHLFGLDMLILAKGLPADDSPTLESYPQSPATSIAETVAETTQDLRSQRHLENQQEPSESPGTLEALKSPTANDQTPEQTDLSGGKERDLAATGSDNSETQEEREISPAFVENTTYLDHLSESATQRLQQSPRDTEDNIASTVEESLSVGENPQSILSSVELRVELLAVADTPEISEDVTTNDSHPEPQFETTQTSVENESDVFSTERTLLEENAQFPFHSQRPNFFDPRSITESDQRAPGEPSILCNTQEANAAQPTEEPLFNTSREGEILNDSEESTTIDEISQTLERSESQVSKPSRHFSRHDSSQETPERQLPSAQHSSSPLPYPPSYSLQALDSNAPLRPASPTLTSSLSNMADSVTESTADKVERRLKELQASQRASNPYVPSKRIRLSQAPLGPKKIPDPPTINASAEGTRSPSTVPDRSPAPPAKTSLRTVAFANANDKAAESLLENPLAATSTNTDAGPTKEKAELVAAIAATAASSAPETSAHLPTDHDMEELDECDRESDDEDDDDEDDESVYNDDLHLEKDEYIVPLFIDGRQRDTYTQYLERKADLLNDVLDSVALTEDPASEKLDEVEGVLTYLKNVETHPDLTYAEAESATDLAMRSAADVQHGAQFGIDNSVKFKFLSELFSRLRKHSMHIVLLLDQDDDALFNVLRTFFGAAAHNYSMPTKHHQSNASNDTLTITVFPRTASPLIQRVDLVICLDGVQSATQIRQSSWAATQGQVLPVLHLVIPQTIGHIERYLQPSLSKRPRIETILTALGQIEERNEIGNQIDIDTPNAAEAARLVASWLTPDDDQDNTEWPLPSVGSMSNFIVYNVTQQSVRSTASPPAPERAKRPLETDEVDTAKRARYTPPVHESQNHRSLQEPEVTHISDSMPCSVASEAARLAAKIEELKSELLQEQRERREEQIMWNRQQTEHEDRQQQYRKLFGEKAEVDRALESMTRARDRHRSQLDAQATDLRALREQLDDQRDLALSSDNEKDVEITRLRKELEDAKAEQIKALNSVKSTDKTLEYTKEQYREASNAAGKLQTEVTNLESRNEELTRQASGEVAKLRQLHQDKSLTNVTQQNTILKHENATLKATLRQKEEELARAKNNSGRAAYGTRGQSTTPQPKTRSRAASPERVSRAPRGGGRISNLQAER
ncbi:hypothetical protein OPT61_g4378 [Boeremia exigua]|uniref:Uncharacterized protein n=1 Tax=Boeremia exigua TaxID=749465 RepID=A0ACC2IEF8_9PLEO|nr:hypothetical protein OPT61_g4378 [Boeremia exigua]